MIDNCDKCIPCLVTFLLHKIINTAAHLKRQTHYLRFFAVRLKLAHISQHQVYFNQPKSRMTEKNAEAVRIEPSAEKG